MNWIQGLRTRLSHVGQACLTPAGFSMCCQGVLGLMAAIFVATLVRDVIRTKNAYERLEAAGVLMRMDRQNYPSILAGPRVWAISFDASNLSVELLKSASCLPNVTEVMVENTYVSDQIGSQLLASFPRLQRLFFKASKLDDAALDSLPRCRHLSLIGISWGRLTQRQSIAISRSASITWVNLHRTRLTNGALSELWKTIELTTLSLHTATFSLSEFAGIHHATKLESLNITNTGISNEHLPQLASCHSLKKIQLERHQFSDQTVEELGSTFKVYVHDSRE